MVGVTETFTFQEWRNNRLAHIFALCDIGTGIYEPVSQLGHQRVRGIELQNDGRQLRVRLPLLPQNFAGALIGIYVTSNQSLTWADYRLQLTWVVEPGRKRKDSSRVLHPHIENAQRGDRFAVLAQLLFRGGKWYVEQLDPPAVFKDKYELSSVYPTPIWWRQRA